MWSLSYSKEVRNYIYDSYPYTEAVWQAIKSLRQTQDGIPSTGWKKLESELYLWLVAEHWVVYQRLVDEQQLIVTVLKPIAEQDFDVP
jgi:hypothetical protein